MATFRDRCPPRREVAFVFAACAFPIYSWSILQYFYKLPSWLLQLDIWDLIGTFAYAQVFAFVESAIILLVLLLLKVLLPRSVFEDRFVAQSSALVFVTSVWAILIQFNLKSLESLSLPTLVLWIPGYLVSIGIPFVLIRRQRRLEMAINTVVERLTVLLYIYLPLSLLSAVVILVRNV